MADLQLKDVCKTYPENICAVSPTSLQVKDGEFVILVGPSGCGKSTLQRMIAGLETASQGEIHIDGKLINNVPAKDRDIAMVFQNYALYPHMTVYENMAFGLKMRKLPKSEIDDRVRSAMEILGLNDFLARRPKGLSGGQRQRVAVGRAIVRQPKLFQQLRSWRRGRMLAFTWCFFLVGLQAIPIDLYEAAELDGASAWQKFRLIPVRRPS